MNVTDQQVREMTGDVDRWSLPINAAVNKWMIDTPARLAHWLAQMYHESTGFTTLVENLKYSAPGLLRVFKGRFTEDEAHDFARDERRIAERVYGGRFGNGPEGSGDGWRYRGRGLPQLTFKRNYDQAGNAMGVDLLAMPELLEQPIFAADVGGWYWTSRGCNEFADRDDLEGVTRCINGGLNGLPDRLIALRKAKAALA